MHEVTKQFFAQFTKAEKGFIYSVINNYGDASIIMQEANEHLWALPYVLQQLRSNDMKENLTPLGLEQLAEIMHKNKF
jgi:hypothetical protein